MKKRLAAWILISILLVTGCVRKPTPTEAPVQTETQTQEPTTDSTEETTIEPLILPTEEESQTIPVEQERNNNMIVATDIHYLARELTDQKSGFQYMVEHGDGKLVNYVWEITDAFIDEVIEAKPQILILSGDLSLNGEKLSHQELAVKLRAIEEAGIPIVVIPGNHDINCIGAAAYKEEVRFPAERTTPEDFVEIYRRFGYDEAISRDPDSLSYMYQLDDYNRLMMIDSCQYDGGTALIGGMIKLETYGWMEEQLEVAWEEGMNVIPVAHHNLLEESQVYLDDCTIEHSEELERLLGEWGSSLFLSGHLHVQHYKSSQGFGLDEIVTSSLTTAPCQYGMIEYWDDGSFRYQTKAVDMQAWAKREGSSDKNLLDFPRYSHSFLEKVFYNKVMDSYKHSDIPEKEKIRMANLYAKLNTWSYAGRAMEIEAEIMADSSYLLWEKHGGDSILFQYIEEILRDATRDYNSFSN